MMGKRSVFLVLICMLIVLACSVHVNAVIKSGNAYASIFVCVSDTECSPLIHSVGPIPAVGEAGAALNIVYSGITSKCVPGEEGNHYVWYQVDTDTPRNSGAADGKANSNDTYTVNWDASATYCTAQCTDVSPIRWDSTEGECCGDDGGSTDTWLNSANRGCEAGIWVTNLDTSQTLCNMQPGGPGSDCYTTGETKCWAATAGRCCGDDVGETWTDGLVHGCVLGIYQTEPDDLQTLCELQGHNWDTIIDECCGDDLGELDTWVNAEDKGCDAGAWIDDLDDSQTLCNMEGGFGDCDADDETYCWNGSQCCGDDGSLDTWADGETYGCIAGVYRTEPDDLQTLCELQGHYWDINYPGGQCCGDDSVFDTWLNPDEITGCDVGTYVDDRDQSQTLCNWPDIDPQDDCSATDDTLCWDVDRGSDACCGDDFELDIWVNAAVGPLIKGCLKGSYCAEDLLTRGDYMACCPYPTDYVEGDDDCFRQSIYKHPTGAGSALYDAYGNRYLGLLQDGNPYPYNQTITFTTAGAVVINVMEIEGYFSTSDKAVNPTTNEGYVNLSEFHLQADGDSVYVNASAVTTEMNRISDEYTIFIPNNNDGEGIIICTDPEDGVGEYGTRCTNRKEFFRAKSDWEFTVAITESYYEITTSLNNHTDWYVYQSVQPSLNIYADTGRRSFDNVTFYAELKVGPDFIGDAVCKIHYHDGRNETMIFNESDGKFKYTRQYTSHGTYEYEIRCTPSFYLPVSSTNTVLIEPNSQLVIGDQTDSSGFTGIIGEPIEFYAYYRTLPERTPITEASCNITYHNLKEDDMDYETGEGFYSEDRSYPNYGRFSYTVKCARAGYDTLVDIDTVEVFPESCNKSEMNESYMVPGKGKFTLISKRGFVLIEKPG